MWGTVERVAKNRRAAQLFHSFFFLNFFFDICSAVALTEDGDVALEKEGGNGVKAEAKRDGSKDKQDSAAAAAAAAAAADDESSSSGSESSTISIGENQAAVKVGAAELRTVFTG